MLERTFALAALVAVMGITQRLSWPGGQDTNSQIGQSFLLGAQLFVWGGLVAMILGPQARWFTVALAAGTAALLGQGLAALASAPAWVWLGPACSSAMAGALSYHILARVTTEEGDYA